jgi:hypothetical protein
MPCKDFEIFDKYNEEELAAVSFFLFGFGRALSMEPAGMHKERWLEYHKIMSHEDTLKEFLPGFNLPFEELPKHLQVDASELEGLTWQETKKKGRYLGVLKSVAEFRLARGL